MKSVLFIKDDLPDRGITVGELIEMLQMVDKTLPVLIYNSEYAEYDNPFCVEVDFGVTSRKTAKSAYGLLLS